MCNNKNDLLYTKATHLDFIEYVQIYPHRIHYDSEIYYIQDEKVVCIYPNYENTINITSCSDDNNTNYLYNLLLGKTIKHIFVKFDETMNISSIFNVVKNISRALTFL